MKKYQNIFFSILLLIIVSSCKTIIEEKDITPVSLERCKDCIYLSDFHKFELELESTPVSFKNYTYYKPLIIKWYSTNAISANWNTERHFYLRDSKKDSLNTLVCYISQQRISTRDSINKEEHIIEKEIYKIFTEDTYLDKLKVPYVKKGNYKILKKYYKGLTFHIPDSLMKRPSNYPKFDNQNIESDNYFKNKKDIQSHHFSQNLYTGHQSYTLTLNRESYDADDAFNKGEKIYRLRDMAIYVTYDSDIPSSFFSRQNKFTLNNIEQFVKFIDGNNENKIISYKTLYDSLLSKSTKSKIDIIRKNRGQPPFKVFLDSVESYKKIKGIK